MDRTAQARPGFVALLAAASLAPLGCWRACVPMPPPYSPEEAPAAEAAAAPDVPEPPGAERCSYEEAQRLTRLLERGRAAELRTLADGTGATALAMVPLRLQYDGAGRVEAARLRVRGHDPFASALDAAARQWRLEGVRRAGTCELALQIPKSEVAPPPPEEAPEYDGP